MISFKEFLEESAKLRKFLKGSGANVYNIPGSKVIHHDPNTETTIYHALSPEGLYNLGSGTSWCTNTRNNIWAHSYLHNGNVFVVHNRNKRYQVYIPHDTDKMPYDEVSDEHGKDEFFRFRDSGLLDKLKKIPHATKHINVDQWKAPTQKEKEDEII